MITNAKRIEREQLQKPRQTLLRGYRKSLRLLQAVIFVSTKKRSITGMQNMAGTDLIPDLQCQFTQRMENWKDIIFFMFL